MQEAAVVSSRSDVGGWDAAVAAAKCTILIADDHSMVR
jgi:hypothetical protein